MKKMLGIVLSAAGLLAMGSAAQAADGCGRGAHRGPYGRCQPNYARGPAYRPGGVALVIGNYYPNRGYWDGRRYWQHRQRWHNGWRYR
jgi:hypothetical protein